MNNPLNSLVNRLTNRVRPSTNTTPIERYQPPMHGSETTLAQCCNARYVGISEGDHCQYCGSRFIHPNTDTHQPGAINP